MTTAGLVAARAVADECAAAYQDAFADRLVAVYLLGSAAYGGWSPQVSDIDVAVVLADARDGDADAVAATQETLRGCGGLHPKLSIFWSSLPALRGGADHGRFPTLDRLQLADHGVLLRGVPVAAEVARPTSAELLLESARFAIAMLATDEVVAEFRTPRRLLTDPGLFTKAVLFPVRFLFSMTRKGGQSATNTEAITWYLARPDPTAASLVELAARVRDGHPFDPELVAAELAAGLIPLYQRYIDDQEPWLRRPDTPADVVEAFALWRRDLMGWPQDAHRAEAANLG